MDGLFLSFLFVLLGMQKSASDNVVSITGEWLLKMHITMEYRLTKFDEDVIVVFKADGRYLTNPKKTPTEEQTNSYTFDGSEISFFEFDPATKKRAKTPYSKYKVLKLTATELHIRTSETNGKPPLSHQVMEYIYHRK